MYKHKKLYLLNFGAKLSDEVINALAVETQAEHVEQRMVKVNLELSKNPYIQCHDVVLSVKDVLLDENPFVVNLPGLPIACVFIVNEITAITGREPTIIFTSRNISGESYFSEFKFRRLFNLSYEKTITREKFKNACK